jgi:hypothetical protein
VYFDIPSLRFERVVDHLIPRSVGKSVHDYTEKECDKYRSHCNNRPPFVAPDVAPCKF